MSGAYGIVCRLRSFREDRGLTQVDLAEALLVSRQTIISIEQGRYAPSLDLALRLAKFFAVPIENLFQLQDDGQAMQAS